MEIGPVTTTRPPQRDPRPVGTVAPAGAPVGTATAPSRAVRPVARAAGADRPRDAVRALPESVQRQGEIDGATVISRVFDGATGDLLSQVPDRALLRLKVYAREDAARLDAEAARRRLERTV